MNFLFLSADYINFTNTICYNDCENKDVFSLLHHRYLFFKFKIFVDSLQEEFQSTASIFNWHTSCHILLVGSFEIKYFHYYFQLLRLLPSCLLQCFNQFFLTETQFSCQIMKFYPLDLCAVNWLWNSQSQPHKENQGTYWLNHYDNNNRGQ